MARFARFPSLVVLIALVLLGSAMPAYTQCSILNCPPTPRPTPRPTPTLTPPATDDPDPSLLPGTPKPTKKPGAKTPVPTKSPAKGSPTPTPTGTGDPAAGEVTDDLPEGLKPEDLVVPNIARTRARNTSRLVKLLQPLTELGIPFEQALVEGMGRFPIAGRAYYSDDWLNPRYNPVPHLHHGLDIFADFGTPIRAPEDGTISRTSSGATGGIGVYLRSGGTEYYFAHLLEIAEGIRSGLPVKTGTVLGYVGDTGNASGGAPHLHFEVHRPGPIPPKPSVDAWLDEAEARAPEFVELKRRQIDAARGIVGPGAIGDARPDLEASMLLTLLDPVGGSIGLLPQLPLERSRRSAVSDRLLAELIHMRLDGYLLAPSSQGIHLTD